MDIWTITSMTNVKIIGVFFTKESFGSREEVVEWARKNAKSLNMFLVIGHSTTSTPECYGRVELQCERSGTPADGVINSKKIECPFCLRCVEKMSSVWSIEVVDGKHNHDMGKYVEGHATSGRLDKNKGMLIERLSKSMAPKQILSQLKLQDSSDSTTIKQIYNFLSKHNRKTNEGSTVFQQLMKVLRESNYSYWFRTDEEKNSLKDLIFFHPWSIKCLHSFPQVLIMDTTYNTNRYKQPLLEIVGFTSTWKTFVVGYAFLNSEDKETFVWALEVLKRLVKSEPNVIVTDRDLALVYAVEKVFSTSAHFLCQRHIEMDIESHVTKLFKSVGLGKNVAKKWKRLIRYKSEM